MTARRKMFAAIRGATTEHARMFAHAFATLRMRFSQLVLKNGAFKRNRNDRHRKAIVRLTQSFMILGVPFLISPCVHSQDAITDNIAGLRPYCQRLSFAEKDCVCASEAAETVKDDNIAGRFALAYAAQDKQALNKLKTIMVDSDFYEGIHKFSLQDKQALLFERTLLFQQLLKRACDLQLEPPKSMP